MPTVTPGKVFAEDELVTRTKLNQLGAPIVELNDEDVDLVVADVRQSIPTINRNILINGNFDVWQRGGSVDLVAPITPSTLGSGTGPAVGADRWFLGTPSGASKREITAQGFTMGQTDVPGANYYLRWNELVAETGVNRPVLSQRIEDVHTLAGKNAVVTWWMKGNYSGNITCQLLRHSGYTITPEAYPDVTIAAETGGTAVLVSGAAWTKYTATFEVPSLSGFGIEGAEHFLELRFLLPDNVTFQIDFAQVQMEEGLIPTPFEFLPYATTLGRCKRYFEYHSGIAWDDITHGSPCYYFATTKFRSVTLTLVSGYAGTMTAANFTALLDTGYYQDTANSVVSAFFMICEAEIGMP